MTDQRRNILVTSKGLKLGDRGREKAGSVTCSLYILGGQGLSPSVPGDVSESLMCSQFCMLVFILHPENLILGEPRRTQSDMLLGKRTSREKMRISVTTGTF